MRINKDNAVDKNKEEVMDKESPMECPKHGNPMTSMATHMSNFQKKYQKLMSQLNDYGTVSQKISLQKISIDNPSQ